MNDNIIERIEEIMKPMAVKIESGEFEQTPHEVLEEFFGKLTSADLQDLIRYTHGSLAVERERLAGQHQDMARIQEAMAEVIRKTDGAETLNDVVRIDRADPHSLLSDRDDLAIAELVAREIPAEETTSTGRYWEMWEVIYIMQRDSAEGEG